jgi:hypothetical protein
MHSFKEIKMKYMKIFGLAAMALAALMAIAGTASATTLTSPSGTTYTSTIKAVNEGAITLTSVFGGFGAISCSESTIEGKVETHGSAVTPGGVIEKFTWEKCTKTATVIQKGTWEIHANGQKTLKNLSIRFHQTAFGTCEFTASNTGTSFGTVTTTAQTGGNATIDVKASLPSPCGTGTLEGAYVITTPSPLYIDA